MRRMNYRDIIKKAANKYSYTEFLKVCADNAVDACDANQWALELQAELVSDVVNKTEIAPSSYPVKSCCGGGAVR